MAHQFIPNAATFTNIQIDSLDLWVIQMEFNFGCLSHALKGHDQCVLSLRAAEWLMFCAVDSLWITYLYWPQKPECRQTKLFYSQLCVYLYTILLLWSKSSQHCLPKHTAHDFSIYFNSPHHAQYCTHSPLPLIFVFLLLFIASLSASLAFSHLTLNSS